MKKRLIKLLGLTLAISMSMVMAGCSNTPKEEKTNSASSTTQDNKEKTDGPSGTVMLYSSMQDAQLAAIKEGFTQKYPHIQMDYYAAGTGKVMTKIATEQQAGGVAADMIWVGDPSNYLDFKQKDMLYTYESKEAVNVPKEFIDKDNQFIAGRAVSMGFVYNKNLVSEDQVPKTWEDLLNPEFKDNIAFADPTSSGTTLYTVAGLSQNENYGWDYFKKLKDNGLKLESGSSAVVNKVGAGEYKICLGADHVARLIESQGSPIGFSYLEGDMVVIASPLAITSNSKNLDNAKLLYDFIISEEGQKILVEKHTTPIHKNVSLAGVPTVDELAKKSMRIDDEKLVKEKLSILEEFDSIFKVE